MPILCLLPIIRSKKRPFYAMDDPEDTTYTLSFDLLFHGLEITTGGQRIHDYQTLVDKIAAQGNDAGRHGAVHDDFQTWHAATWWTGNWNGAL